MDGPAIDSIPEACRYIGSSLIGNGALVKVGVSTVLVYMAYMVMQCPCPTVVGCKVDRFLALGAFVLGYTVLNNWLSVPRP